MVTLPMNNIWDHSSEEDRITYVLPDGQSLDVRVFVFSLLWLANQHAQKVMPTTHQITHEHQLAPEVLFRPDIVGLEHPGIHQCAPPCPLFCYPSKPLMG